MAKIAKYVSETELQNMGSESHEGLSALGEPTVLEKYIQLCVAELLESTLFIFLGCLSVLVNPHNAGPLIPALVHGFTLASVISVLGNVSPKCTNVSDMFMGQSFLGPNCTYVSDMFMGQSFLGPKCTNVSDMFMGQSFLGPKCTNVSDMFMGQSFLDPKCTNVSDMFMGQSFLDPKCTNVSDMFMGQSFLGPKCTNVSDMFMGHSFLLFQMETSPTNIKLSFSGGHFNPAVTLSVVICGGLTPILLVPYWICQLSGGMLVALLAKDLADQESFINHTGALMWYCQGKQHVQFNVQINIV
ncbi:hypothetical protein XELAEV_18044193mg [Xenopus laevis]|uniref:Uncharacterized protein n=1 Tax=Xenopus laevis TaxID=8355 RepID=A0A974BYE0_XENLA|nr:hypothetical protein XELAEV_18044193mg [Xenopus laevis]